MSPRLTLLRASGEVPLDGAVCLVGAGRGFDVTALAGATVEAVQPFAPDHAWLAGQGIAARVDWPETADVVIVVLPRAKAQALDWIARAAGIARQALVIDGQKTDGVESVLKAVQAIAPLGGTLSKAHGKLAWCAPAPGLAALAPPAPAPVAGLAVAHGVFSADGVDPASAALADALPGHLGRTVADFGAGWGYLSATVLRDARLERLHLIEADHVALDCARANIGDPRAAFHWADATAWRAPAPLDAVVMNPPFHTGRAADPALGQAFIASAARNLSPRGVLWLVANRHLPYERGLAAAFREVSVRDAAGGAFKIVEARGPRRLEG